MHVTLIQPPAIAAVSTFAQEAVPPIGLAYVAAAVRAAGHAVEVVDAVGLGLDRHALYAPIPRSVLTGLPLEEILARIPIETDVIGVSCMFSNAWCPTRDLLVAIRAARPRGANRDEQIARRAPCVREHARDADHVGLDRNAREDLLEGKAGEHRARDRRVERVPIEPEPDRVDDLDRMSRGAHGRCDVRETDRWHRFLRERRHRRDRGRLDQRDVHGSGAPTRVEITRPPSSARRIAKYATNAARSAELRTSVRVLRPASLARCSMGTATGRTPASSKRAAISTE